MPDRVYVYRNVAVVNVHDGDTATFRLTSDPVDIGFGFTVTGSVGTFPCRLLRMAARELAAPGGPEARDYLAGLLGNGAGLTVTSVRWDKYAPRFDGLIALPDGRDCADAMIAAGYAVAWDGRGVQPVPAWPIGIH